LKGRALKMKKLFFCAIFVSLLIPLVAHANPVTFLDNDTTGYWGGIVYNAGATAYGDVIGNPFFSVSQMVVTQTGSIWTVALSGEYFNCRQSGTCDGGLASRLAPGDLYISAGGYTTMTPDNPHFETDYFSLDEGWNYIIPLDPTEQSGNSGIYSLTDEIAGITMTNVSPLGNGYIYRQDQAWRGGAVGDSLGGASYAFSGDTLTFTFDASNLNWSGEQLGFHWTMQCGNDVVEGTLVSEAPPQVPEPSTLLLLGLGLTGVAAFKKIRS
jgi:hypothetical protein